MPWKNGLGITHEIIAAPEGEQWRWRVSLADITASASFSPFPGIDRTIAIVEGNGMRLEVDGFPIALKRCEPFAFSGDATAFGHLTHGRVRDLNLMTRRGEASGSVRFLETGRDETLRGTRSPGVTLYVVVEGALLLDDEALVPFDALFLDPNEELQAQGSATLAEITLSLV